MRGDRIGAFNVRYTTMTRLAKPLISLRGSSIGLFLRLSCLRVPV